MASTQINYTQGTPTNGIKYTLSMWVKRSNTDSGSNYLASVWVDGSNHWCMRFIGDQLDIYDNVSGSTTTEIKTNRKFKDCSAWYHIVYVYDSANATPGDRMKLYVNGVEETSFATDTNPSSSYASILNVSGRVLTIGARNSASYWDGSMSHINFIDGTACLPTVFGETDATDGMWKIKTSPSVTYGNNGFFLKMEDSSNLDLDSSGNSHTFTTTGTLTATKDNPSNNFTTMNPLLKSSYCTLSNGNTKTAGNSASDTGNCSTTLLATTGLYYAEIKSGTIYGTTYPRVGVQHTPNTNYGRGINGTDGGAGGAGTPNGIEGYACANGQKFTSNVLSSFGSAWIATDILAVAMDCTNGAAYVAINNVWQNSGDPTSGASKTGALVTWTPADVDATAFASCDYNGSFLEWNFGNGYFGSTAIGSPVSAGEGLWKYTPPTNYGAFCTKNINAA